MQGIWHATSGKGSFDPQKVENRCHPGRTTVKSLLATHSLFPRWWPHMCWSQLKLFRVIVRYFSVLVFPKISSLSLPLCSLSPISLIFLSSVCLLTAGCYLLPPPYMLSLLPQEDGRQWICIRSTDCSFREPGFSSQHLCLAAAHRGTLSLLPS